MRVDWDSAYGLIKVKITWDVAANQAKVVQSSSYLLVHKHGALSAFHDGCIHSSDGISYY